MSVPTGWLPSPMGSGSAANNRALPAPAQGTYTEPSTAISPAPYNS